MGAHVLVIAVPVGRGMSWGVSFSANRMFLSLTSIVLEELRPPDSRSSPEGGVPNAVSLLLHVGIPPGRRQS